MSISNLGIQPTHLWAEDTAEKPKHSKFIQIFINQICNFIHIRRSFFIWKLWPVRKCIFCCFNSFINVIRGSGRYWTQDIQVWRVNRWYSLSIWNKLAVYKIISINWKHFSVYYLVKNGINSILWNRLSNINRKLWAIGSDDQGHTHLLDFSGKNHRI